MEIHMPRSICLFFTVTLLALPFSASADVSKVPSGVYTLDSSHGYITFTYSHLGFSNPRVGFNSFDTKLELDSDDPENSTIGVTIDASSIDSRVAEFNKHLNGSDFFNTAEHPTITFESTKVEATGAYVPAVSDEVELSIEVELLAQ